MRGVYRFELTSLEQYVLVSIFDESWKNHLYAMDMLKGGIGLQAFAEKDPRVAYKREGYRYFNEMMMGIRDKVTNIIFRVNTNGREEENNTIAWSPKPGQASMLQATVQYAGEESGSFLGWALLVAGLTGGAALIVVVLALIAHKRNVMT